MQNRTIATSLITLFLSGAMAATTARAQEPLTFSSSQLDIGDNGFKGDIEGFFIPTVYLNITHHGGVFVANGGASAKAKYVVNGLDNDLVQGLSRKIQEDLAAKLRAAGHKVMLYEDLKSDPEVVNKNRQEPDKKLGIVTKDAPANAGTFVVGTGTPEQAFKPAMQGISWSFRNVAKQQKVGVIIPEIWIGTPQMATEKSRGYKSSKASIDVDPGMSLGGFFVWTIGPKQAGGWVKLKEPVGNIAENVGTVVKESEDRTDLGLGMKRAKGDYTMTLDRDAFSAGVLRAGYAMNDAIVAAIAKTRK